MMKMKQVISGPVYVEGDLFVTGQINKGFASAYSNNVQAQQFVQGVLKALATQPNELPQANDLRLYAQNAGINGQVVPGGTDGFLQVDKYINGAWQHLFEVQPSTTGNINVLDLFISGRLFARDSLLSAPGRFFSKTSSFPFLANTVYGLAYGSGVFVAVGQGGSIARSTNAGSSFGALITNPFGGTNIDAIAYGGGIFIAVGGSGKIARSTDLGATWGSLITNPFSTGNLYGIAYSATTGTFIAVSTVGTMSRSTDLGVTWSALITNPFAGTFILGLAYGNGVWVAVGNTGTIARSTDDGLTWGSTISGPFGANNVECIAYGNGVFIAAGGGGKISRSVDGGVTWSALITNPFGTDDISAIAYGNGVFIASSSVGNVSRSLDLGVTWGIRYGDGAALTVQSTSINAIATDGLGHFLIGGLDGSQLSVSTSDYVEAGAGIIDSGHNTNGYYIRFADGTQIAWWQDDTNRTTALASAPYFYYSVTKTFPFAFAGLPFLIDLSSSAGWFVNMSKGSIGPTAAVIYLWNLQANTASGFPGYMAIGRWKL